MLRAAAGGNSGGGGGGGGGGYSAAVLADAPLAYYRLNETSGTVCADSSGHGKTGTYPTSGVTLGVAGLTNDGDKACQFAGSSDIVLPVTLQGAANVTLECLFNMPAVNDKGVFIKISRNTANGYALGVGSGNMDTAGTTLLGLYEGVRWLNSGHTLTPGKHHCALVIDASGFPHIYLDGAQVYTDTGGGALAPSTNGGGIGGYGARWITGVIDEVALYSAALSATQIANHYAAI